MKRKAVWISCILTAIFCGRSADARVIITLDQVGPNVVATGSGTVNTTGLHFVDTFGGFTGVVPSIGLLSINPIPIVDVYGGISGPTSFGSGSGEDAIASPGDNLRLNGASFQIGVPGEYVSGAPLSAMATFNNTTIARLGVDVGTFTWTWGTGANADSLRLIVTPEPGTVCLLGTSVIGLAGMVRRRLRLGK